MNVYIDIFTYSKKSTVTHISESGITLIDKLIDHRLLQVLKPDDTSFNSTFR